jgi:RNA polymerase sigma-70 factor, ECF subfamily
MEWMSASALPPTSELFVRYGAMVYRRCLEILRLPEDATDAVQEIFLKVHARRDSYRGEAAPSTWLYGAATLHCLQGLRNRVARDAKLGELVSAEPHWGPPIEERLALLEVIARLPEEVAVTAYLRYVDGMTLDEVAEVVGRSRKTVASRLEEFLSHTRAELETPLEAP